MCQESQIIGEMNIKVLNAVETTMLDYAKKHGEFVGNVYQHFAKKLGYKSKNYIYSWFKERDATKIGLSDIDKIIKITGDDRLAEIIYEELKRKR